jgi:Arc/MetJ-type ribon-helix-helix transcriptional regulator
VTIQVPQDLVGFVKEAVQTGQYARNDDVIRDALVRLRQAMAAAGETDEQTDQTSVTKKLLTKQTLQRHLAEIGLVDQMPEAGSGRHAAGAAVDNEEEIISEIVIRERLIEWLAGFLS